MLDRTAGFPHDVHAGLRVSVVSLVWTVAAGCASVGIGVAYRSLVLVAFGAVGLVDAIGSATLLLHFRHALSSEAISARHERTAHLVVTAGMGIIGLATVGDSVYRLVTRPAVEASVPGVVLSGVSIVVLSWLSRRKRGLARSIPSGALAADGWLSACGAVLAGVAVAGTGLDAGLGWWWIDPVAAAAVGAGAFVLSVVLASTVRRLPSPRPASRSS